MYEIITAFVEANIGTLTFATMVFFAIMVVAWAALDEIGNPIGYSLVIASVSAAICQGIYLYYGKSPQWITLPRQWVLALGITVLFIYLGVGLYHFLLLKPLRGIRVVRG